MKNHSLFPLLLTLMIAASVTGCGGGSSDSIDSPDNTEGNGGDGDGDNGAPLPADSKGIVFVAQPPNPGGTSDIQMHTATFGNGQPGIGKATRGGSLYFLDAGGDLRDLLDEALKNGCEAGGDALCDENGSLHVGDNGLLRAGYVVRRPRVHWDADRLLFSMTFGAKHEQHGEVIPANPKWQLYEIAGLDPDDTPVVTRVPNQPEGFNNFDGVYGSENGVIFFISDKTVTGNPHHYPQRDEYESLPINTGLWRMNVDTGEIVLMDHSPSGDFGPEITPRGQVIFTRWDHLQRDQQAENAKLPLLDPGAVDFWGAYTYEDENDFGEDDYRTVADATATNLQAFVDSAKTDTTALTAAADGDEMFPEPLSGNPFYNWGNKDGDIAGRFDGEDIAYTLPETEYGAMNPLRFNHFLPWQIRQDGLQCETYRHTGLHENGGFVRKALLADPRIDNIDVTKVEITDGFFLNQVFDDPQTGFEIVTGVVAPKFGTHKGGKILQFIDTDATSAPKLHENADAVEYKFLTDPENDDRLYRDPLFLSDGRLVAAVSDPPVADDDGSTRHFGAFNFRLYVLEKNDDGFHEPAEPLLPASINRDFDYWEENGGVGLHAFSGSLWEIEAQEVVTRNAPAIPPAPGFETPELQAFTDASVTPSAFRDYLKANNLAAIVVRNATTRDEADVTQPFNLFVRLPNGDDGVRTVSTGFQQGDMEYPITYLQLMRGDYLRGYEKFAEFSDGSLASDDGRRVLPNPLGMDGKLVHNLDVGSIAPEGAVPVAADGSIAALVPAHRAMTWQTTDDDGDPVVRERYWLTFQPGEVRVCASCHGINDRGQDGNAKPQNSPQALRALLETLKAAGEL